MQDCLLSYREVIVDNNTSEQWQEVHLNTGGTQGTLQDIKVAERANGYCYQDATKSHTRNRFIYWRISHDVLELVEHSLDINLTGNQVRYRFGDTPVLDGVSIHETIENVVVLVPTVSSVHRLLFPHPDQYHRSEDESKDFHAELSAPSIFADAKEAPNYMHIYANSLSHSSQQLPHLADCYLEVEHGVGVDAYFLIGYPQGALLLIRLIPDGKAYVNELKYEFTIMPKFLSGLADKLRHKDKDGEITVSLALQHFEANTYALALTRNGQLKFWSCRRNECVAVIDVMEETDNVMRAHAHGPQAHMLRTSIRTLNTNAHFVAIFMSFVDESLIYVFKPIVTGLTIRLIRVKTLHLPQNDLLDFSLSDTQLWSVWRSKDGDSEVFTAPVCSNVHNWQPVILNPLPDADQVARNLDTDFDPGHAYMQLIFQPGHFPLQVIGKALNIFRRTIGNASSGMGDISLSPNVLKQQIRMAVEQEIHNELKDDVVSDDEYLECSSNCWQRFYSCCVQYYMTGLKPLCVVILPSVGGALLLKKSSFSILRPMEMLEHLILCSDYTPSVTQLSRDVLNLVKVIVYLNEQLSDAFQLAFEKELDKLNSPDTIMDTMLQNIENEMDVEFSVHVSNMLTQCGDLYEAIRIIVELLRNDIEAPEVACPLLSISSVFSSQLGIAFVSGSIQQQLQLKLLVCRNLLLVKTIVLERDELDWNTLEAIRSISCPEINLLTQTNYVLYWFAKLPVIPYGLSDAAMQRLSILKLRPAFNIRFKSWTSSSLSLLEMFVGSTGSHVAHKKFLSIFNTDESIGMYQQKHSLTNEMVHWRRTLTSYLNCLYHTMWPINNAAILSEWLLSSGQHLWLQLYCRLVNPWCDWNSCTNNFLLGVSLLACGETRKAVDLFVMASKGIFCEPYLTSMFVQPFHHTTLGAVNVGQHERSENDMNVSYYLKLIHLFELHRAYDCVISLAETALTAIQDVSAAMTATLYSIKFKHHLTLKNYRDAFNALITNPDEHRRKDNLHDLVKKLLDERQLDILMSLSYGNMESMFCNMVMTRARATDAANNVYYDFLYAFYTLRKPARYRMAASIMYEQSIRLGECNDVNALRKQVKCLMTTKVALELCAPAYSWLLMATDEIDDDAGFVKGDSELPEYDCGIKPHEFYESDEEMQADDQIDGDRQRGDDEPASRRSPRNQSPPPVPHISEERDTGPPSIEKQRQTHPLYKKLVSQFGKFIDKTALDTEFERMLMSNKKYHYTDIGLLEREFAFCSAKLRLVQFNADALVSVSNAEELIVLLSSAGLITPALQLCQKFQLIGTIPIQMLTKKCVHLSEQPNEGAWKWLIENDIQELPFHGDNVSDAAWNLLQHCLQRYELEHMSQLHRAVCRQLVQLEWFIPEWIVASYKLRNPGELLYILYEGGQLLEAANLAVDHLMAAQGYGKEMYGFKTSMHPFGPQYCLPLRTMLLLLYQLEEAATSGPHHDEELEHTCGLQASQSDDNQKDGQQQTEEQQQDDILSDEDRELYHIEWLRLKGVFDSYRDMCMRNTVTMSSVIDMQRDVIDQMMGGSE